MLKLEYDYNNDVYYEFIRQLRNDPEIQQGFIQQVNINVEQQKEYMKKYGKYYYVCLYNNIPCGYIGVIDNDIRFAVHQSYQGKGIGTFMLTEIKKIFPNAYGKIKVFNKPSIKAFEKSGFELKYFIYE
jgi:RimJ/RimL family protein N-acetyltransferase